MKDKILNNLEDHILKTSKEEFLKDWEDIVSKQCQVTDNNFSEVISDESLEYFNGFRLIVK